jgi:hypothetical protein
VHERGGCTDGSIWRRIGTGGRVRLAQSLSTVNHNLTLSRISIPMLEDRGAGSNDGLYAVELTEARLGRPRAEELKALATIIG